MFPVGAACHGRPSVLLPAAKAGPRTSCPSQVRLAFLPRGKTCSSTAASTSLSTCPTDRATRTPVSKDGNCMLLSRFTRPSDQCACSPIGRLRRRLGRTRHLLRGVRHWTSTSRRRRRQELAAAGLSTTPQIRVFSTACRRAAAIPRAAAMPRAPAPRAAWRRPSSSSSGSSNSNRCGGCLQAAAVEEAHPLTCPRARPSSLRYTRPGTVRVYP